jgi:transcription elongation factor GreA
MPTTDTGQPREITLTREGFKKLEAKLEHLKTHQRREVAERIRQAKEFGEIGENAEYEDAKSEQAFVEGEILNLENTLRHAKIIDESDIHTDVVSVGSVVALKELDSGEEIEYQIVGTNEADPANGKISDESPVGLSLQGMKKGQVIEVKVPDGLVKYKVLKITKESKPKEAKAGRRK